jgi:hypothetical protein
MVVLVSRLCVDSLPGILPAGPPQNPVYPSLDPGARTVMELRTSLSSGGSGLAWVPSGEEVWGAADNAVWATSLSGGRRLVYEAPESGW